METRMRRFMLSMLVAAAAAPARAQTVAASSAAVTLGEVLRAVERDNPEIAAARGAWEAARERVSQAATPEKPRVDLERMYSPVGKSLLDGAAEKNIAVTQEIPFPTTLYLQRRVAAREADIAEQAYRAKVREVLARASQAYSALFLSVRSLDIFNENVEIMRRFAKVAESRYAAGHSGQLDALKAQTELTRMLNMTVTAAQEKAADEAMLNAVMNREARAPLAALTDPDPGALDLRADALESEALANRPELRQADMEFRRAATGVALARSEFLPDLMLQFRYRSDPAMGDSRDAVVGFSVPLWFWRPAARVAEARAAKAAAEAQLRAMRVGTTADLASSWVKVQTAQRLAEVYRTTLIPQAEASLRVAESGYQSGGSSFLDLLDAQRSLLNYRLEYYQDLAEYEQRLADLERIVGKELRKP